MIIAYILTSGLVSTNHRSPQPAGEMREWVIGTQSDYTFQSIIFFVCTQMTFDCYEWHDRRQIHRCDSIRLACEFYCRRSSIWALYVFVFAPVQTGPRILPAWWRYRIICTYPRASLLVQTPDQLMWSWCLQQMGMYPGANPLQLFARLKYIWTFSPAFNRRACFPGQAS